VIFATDYFMFLSVISPLMNEAIHRASPVHSQQEYIATGLALPKNIRSPAIHRASPVYSQMGYIGTGLALCKNRSTDTSDPGHFGPKTLRHQCRTVHKTYRHLCRSVQTLRHSRCRSVWTLRHRPGTNNNTVVHRLFLHLPNYGHFGTGAEVSGHFGPVSMVPKCLGSEVSRVRSVLTPKNIRSPSPAIHRAG